MGEKAATPEGRRWSVAVVLALALFARGAAAEDRKFVLAIPGIPPVFLGVLPHVADKAGFFKKYGLDVEIKAFDTGAAAARAVVAGQIDAAMATTPIVVNMDSNANAGLVAIFGMENPDWLIGSTDGALAHCRDLKGQPVGVDAVGGSRAIALKQMLGACRLSLDDVTLVGLSSNVGAAMIAGQLKLGVLHLDDVPILERELGHPLTIVANFADTHPLDNINVTVARADRVAADRDAYVRLLAGFIDATAYMRDPVHGEEVAKIATVTGRSVADAKAALAGFDRIEYWPKDSDGLSRDHLEAVIKAQSEIGGIKPGTAPIAYDKLVDRSVWRDAQALTRR